MRRIRLLSAGLLVATTPFSVSLTIGPAAHASTVFDDFTGPAGAAPDPTKWAVVEGTGWDAGAQDYISEGAVLDGHGHLAIRARETDSGYTSGRVQTKNLASFQYGTLVARIRMPSGHGLWPAFWMVGADEDTEPWPAAGEIDVVEMVSQGWTQYSSLHGPTSSGRDYLQDQIITRGTDLSGEFHNYWITRAEDSITVGVDDTNWGTFTPESLPDGARWVFNKRFYLILNLAVGGGWAGLPSDATDLPANMLVDWVSWDPA